MKTAALALVALAGCHASTDSPDRKEASTMPQAFSCDRAAAILGYPRATAKACKEVLPDFYWIVLQGGGVPRSSFEAQIVVENGSVVTDKGGAVAKRWLTRAKILDHKDAQGFHVATALEVLGAIPSGFDASRIQGSMPQYGVAAGLVFDPFTLTLGTTSYDPSGSSGASGGGLAAPRPARAILRGTADYQFTWTVEKLDNGKDWVQVSQTPLQ